MSKLTASDLAILVMGQSGDGKSTFINKAVGEDSASVSDDLSGPHTKSIQLFSMPKPVRDKRVVLVDTPGFNACNADDTATLILIVNWLATQPRTTSVGILYIRDINQSRSGPEKEYMHPAKFSKHQTKKAFTLALTKWDQPTDNPALRDERELGWKTEWHMKLSDTKRLRVVRFMDNGSSAAEIVSLASQHITSLETVQNDLCAIFSVLTKRTNSLKEESSCFGGMFSF